MMEDSSLSARGSPASVPTIKFEALHALYDNKQQWVRHYETLLAQLTPLSSTGALAICAYLLENFERLDHAAWFVAIPAGMTLFSLWFTWWCDSEIKRQFDQIVTAESGMGFYEIVVEGKPVLPAEYKASPARTRPIVWAGYAAQAVGAAAALVTLLVVLN